MDSASSIAASGMQAAAQRLNVAAYNIANATTGMPTAEDLADPDAFVRGQQEFDISDLEGDDGKDED